MAKDETDGIARCNCKGDAEWMNKMSKKEVTAAVDQTEFVDALGNEVKVEKKKTLSKKEQKKKEKLRKARRARGEVVTDTDEEEWAGFGEDED
jgi:elongation factor 3